MKITDIEVTPIWIPFKDPIRLSYQFETGSSSVIIQVHTDEGIVGLGETVEATYVEHLIPMLQRIKTLCIGEDPFDVERLLKTYLGSGGGAIWWLEMAVKAFAGVEIALWDIIGKKLGVPVYKLLGGRYRARVPITAFLGIKKPEEVAKDALEAVEKGYKTIKLKVGRDPQEDIAIVKKVRDAVGYDVELRVDANQAWTPAMAVRQIRKLERYDLQYVEQPVPRWDIDGLKRVKDAVDVPIAACEAIFSIQRAMDVIKRGAADIISTDPTRMGGFLECKKLCGLAESADIPVVMHVSWGAITTSAWLQMCVSTPNIMYANDMMVANGVGRVNADEVTTTVFEHKNGYLEPLEAPGLGLEINSEKLKKYHEVYLQRKHGKPEFFAYPPMF